MSRVIQLKKSAS